MSEDKQQPNQVPATAPERTVDPSGQPSGSQVLYQRPDQVPTQPVAQPTPHAPQAPANQGGRPSLLSFRPGPHQWAAQQGNQPAPVQQAPAQAPSAPLSTPPSQPVPATQTQPSQPQAQPPQPPVGMQRHSTAPSPVTPPPIQRVPQVSRPGQATPSPAVQQPTQPIPQTPNSSPQPANPPSTAATPGFIEQAYQERFGDRPAPSAQPVRRFSLPPAQQAARALDQSTQNSNWRRYLRQVPRKVWVRSVFAFFALVVTGTVAWLLLGWQQPTGVDRTLPAVDQTRQRDLLEIQEALQVYYEKNSLQYPIIASSIRIDGQTDPLSEAMTPTFLEQMPLDPDFPNQAYRYASLTGKSYVLTAILEDGSAYTLTESGPANQETP